ncbi:hypothetical protein BWD09_03490 [Neisseria dentiae]|uniref:Lipoprotein n=1 Tax=Neisseria dentiae TaxID=194197 RepID=A0A1X3DDQ8_9NEIS|nr:hypothetical protein BWD09_03490 [Neisseria dentiae]
MPRWGWPNFIYKGNIMKALCSALIVLLLAACAQPGTGGQNEIYGEIKGGVETSHTRISR